MDTALNNALNAADSALRTLFATPRSARPTPKPQAMLAVQQDGALRAPAAIELTEAEKSLSASLMRVNHVGEVCAQALYHAQALATRDPALRDHFMVAAEEETDHLAWTEQRMKELGSRPSLLKDRKSVV